MVAALSDIVVTWPQTRTLESYLEELAKADRDGLVINYRVSTLPRAMPERCYMVHSGFVRGWNTVLDMGRRDDVRNPVTGDFLAPGLYIVRTPTWHAIDEVPMRGFQGWRYYDRAVMNDRRSV